MTKKIFITGCAGFIGSHFSEALLTDGYEVVGIDNFNDFYAPEIKRNNIKCIEKTKESQGGKFQLIEGDIRDNGLISKIFQEQQFSLIVHLAAMAGVRPSLENPQLYSDVNNNGTIVLLENAKKAGINNFIFASSSSVYGNSTKVPFQEEEDVDSPVSHYAATKRAGEIVARVYHNLFDMNVLSLRFFTVYGPRQRPDLAINKMTHQILEGKAVHVYGDGSKKRDFTYIDDIIDGLTKATKWIEVQRKPVYEVLNLGESRTTDVNSMIGMIETAIGKKAKIKYEPNIPGDVDQTYASIDKAKRLIGYNPKTNIEEGIEKYVRWVMGNK